jgi:AcrR family transcriptional regulator
MAARKGPVISSAEPVQALNETYDRLIATAIVKFAAVGLDGTSTRDIARDANVALSAINYHFGSKTELYRAAVQHAADWMVKPIEPNLEKVRALLATGPDFDRAVAALIDLTGIVADVLLAPGEEGEAASQLALRELVIPGVGQDIIAKCVVEPIVACATALLKHLNVSGGDQGRIVLDATALFGPTTLFRILNNHSLGTMSATQARSIQDAARQATRRYIMALVNPQ